MKRDNSIDSYFFHEGTHKEAYKFLGSNLCDEGVIFRVWAPNAKSVRVVGEFNFWDPNKNFMEKKTNQGIWELFIHGLKKWELYKFAVEDIYGNIVNKSDPYAFYGELRPGTGSKVYSDDFSWSDQCWMEKKNKIDHYSSPMNIYEIHLGSWRRKRGGEFLTYEEIGEELIPYILEMGYTHVEFMPITEYPLDASWGYQCMGFYGVTSRHGSPEGLKKLINELHRNNIGVILDWVPGHFCKDSSGLVRFDGTPTYEYQDEILSENSGWGTANFDLGKKEVHSFLISSALYWLREFHFDGLRVDAVTNMLYLDFGKSGDSPLLKNIYGGNENLEAINFLQKLNKSILEEFPGNYMFAEESTAWANVTKPDYLGGLGFNYKWNMGWMNDSLSYMEEEMIHRKYHHNKLTFPFTYAHAENYVLPLSHDEVVHLKKSLLDKMPGYYEEKFSNLRLLYGHMMGMPGKKLLFMGGEFGQFTEWNFNKELDWNVLEFQKHRELKRYVKDLNFFYRNEPAFWEKDIESEGYQWIDGSNSEASINSYIRHGRREEESIICIYNFNNIEQNIYRIGVPKEGTYNEIFNSDLTIYGGETIELNKEIKTQKEEHSGFPYSIEIRIPPLSAVYFKLNKNR